MASTTALAHRTGVARERINEASKRLAERFNIPPIVVAQAREQDVRIMLQLEATAAFLESLISVKLYTVSVPVEEVKAEISNEPEPKRRGRPAKA